MRSGILIIHPGALGDVLQAVPALRGLRAIAPLVFAGQPRLGRLLVALDVVDEARGFDSLGLDALFTREPVPAPLAALADRGDRIVSWFGAREPLYRERLASLARETIVAPPVPDEEIPVWRHLIATLARWGVTAPEPPTPLRLDGPAPARAALVAHPGSGAAWKQWPAERFGEVIRAVTARHPLPVVVHQGPADVAAADALMAHLPMACARLVEPDLPTLAAALAAARVYLGGDSGVSHLAAAMGAPSVILFPASTRRRWTPWSPTAVPLTMTGEPDEAARVTREIERRLDE
ncbi:MAG TPA: glycosyltransferase family 9 protein [Methylomirabilota bacterium]